MELFILILKIIAFICCALIAILSYKARRVNKRIKKLDSELENVQQQINLLNKLKDK